LKIFSYKFVYFEQETRKGKRHRDGSHVMATAFVQRKTHQVPQCVIATLFSEKAVLLCCFDPTHPSPIDWCGLINYKVSFGNVPRRP
jgi:hypothetical protein